MIIEILDLAEQDILDGFLFYESQQAGLGTYFIANIYVDIESLRLNAGIHHQVYKNYYRLLSHRFPFAVFYKLNEDRVSIHAVLDCRQDPVQLEQRLS
jgi:plasmid stabilization system protein ParE